MDVEYSCEEAVARIRLNRPERHNAVSARLVEELVAALGTAHTEATVVVLSGSGRSFCAGHDLKEPLLTETPWQTRLRLERLQEVTRLIRTFPVVIAAVHGYALGAGCEFALGCDLIIADDSARFGFPEVGLGLSVTGGISHILPRAVGLPRAKELLLLGEWIDATHAAGLGLINRVVPAGEHEAVAVEWAARIAARPATATGLAKRVLDLGAGSTLDEALATEVDHALLTVLSGEGDLPA